MYNSLKRQPGFWSDPNLSTVTCNQTVWNETSEVSHSLKSLEIFGQSTSELPAKCLLSNPLRTAWLLTNLSWFSLTNYPDLDFSFSVFFFFLQKVKIPVIWLVGVKSPGWQSSFFFTTKAKIVLLPTFEAICKFTVSSLWTFHLNICNINIYVYNTWYSEQQMALASLTYFTSWHYLQLVLAWSKSLNVWHNQTFS